MQYQLVNLAIFLVRADIQIYVKDQGTKFTTKSIFNKFNKK